jgi:hypothetical protein
MIYWRTRGLRPPLFEPSIPIRRYEIFEQPHATFGMQQ